MERKGPSGEEQPRVVSMRELIRQRHMREQLNLDDLDNSELAAYFLTQWAHPATPPERVVEAINGPPNPNPDEPTDSWQLRLDALIDDPDRQYFLQPNDPLYDYFHESLASMDDSRLEQKNALILTAIVYSISQSQLSPKPTHLNAHAVMYKIRKSNNPTTGPLLDAS